MKSKSKEYEQNQIKTTLASFLESYNKSIPQDFPHASEKILKEFQAAHASLFQNVHKEAWSIDVHRKKLMDWLQSYREV